MKYPKRSQYKHAKQKKYHVRNWAEYNEGLRRRGDLTVWFDEEAIANWKADKTGKPGGQRVYSDMAIETGLVVRMVYKLAYRQTEGFLHSIASLLGLGIEIPDYSTLCRRSRLLRKKLRIPKVASNQPIHLNLVRAWRAGNVHLILDGFDEVTGLNIQGLWRKLRDNRYRAMEPVRRLIAEHPSESGLIVAGRAHFFDTDSERRSATGTIEAFLELSLSEFNEKQLQQYLKAQGIEGSLPTWLPSRPLLVAYLVSRGLMKDIVGEWAINADPASGWDLLLDRIADRESQIEAGIDSPTVRRILEKLATKARSSPDGLGPLTSEDIIEGFREVCGYPPDARGMLLLQRLPGLGIDQGEAETRRFIDVSFVEACRSGDVGHFAENPYDLTLFPARIECAAGPLGVAIAANKFRGPAFPGSKLTAAIERACALGNHCLAADLACATIAAGKEVEADIYIKDVLIRELEIGSDAPNASRIHFHDCFLGELDLDPELDSSWIPTFYRCFIGSLYGRVSEEDLPSQAFEECIVDLFATETGTTNQVLDLPFAGGVRVLITVWRCCTALAEREIRLWWWPRYVRA